MYEEMTFSKIMSELLAEVPDTIDKREGSLIYLTLAPCAVKLRESYEELDILMQETFADTASRQYLIKRCQERGVIVKEATKSIVKAEFTPTNIELTNERFVCQNVNFVVSEKISNGIYKLECETAGEAGNILSGMLIPISDVSLQTAYITDCISFGADSEDTEALRKRYFESLTAESFGGNIADYEEKINKISGVGGCKIYPVWNGGGTVKAVIISSQYNTPAVALVEQVQTTIDPLDKQGQGYGLAPIDHIVTVAGVKEVGFSITANFTFTNGYTFAAAQSSIVACVETYFAELRANWSAQQNDEKIIVRISQIENRILDADGVIDVQGTVITAKQNTQSTNFVLESDEIPILSSINANV